MLALVLLLFVVDVRPAPVFAALVVLGQLLSCEASKLRLRHRCAGGAVRRLGGDLWRLPLWRVRSFSPPLHFGSGTRVAERCMARLARGDGVALPQHGFLALSSVVAALAE